MASPLTRRILAVNILAPVILVGGLFYLDRYKNELIDQEIESLRIRAEMVAAALGEGAVLDNGVALAKLSPTLSRQLLRRLAPPARVRMRLFDANGDEMADSRQLVTSSQAVLVEPLPPPEAGWFAEMFRRAYDRVMATRLATGNLPLYTERRQTRAIDFREVMKALGGDAGSGLRVTADHTLLLSTAVPVQHYKRVLGAVMVSSTGEDIAQALFKVRLTIFEAFAFALAITTTLSLYLAGTIARPLRRLAAAAERVRRGHGRRHVIPDLTARDDEIGELSGAFRDMTETLWRRMDGIEAFAADVAHEIKNPLTSLRSAVETAARVTNAEQRDKLLAIIVDDVARLDRLISDISDASRVDAELSRAETAAIGIKDMLDAIAAIYRESGAAENVAIVVEAELDGTLAVNGIEGRLGQVMRNLLSNALSFSPPGASIALRARREGDSVVIEVEDQGPGIPDNKLDAIFERFYSERPSEEKFGTHSGLGLSISRQIAEAHGGRLIAKNVVDGDGQVKGACFTLTLPAAEPVAQTKPREST